MEVREIPRLCRQHTSSFTVRALPGYMRTYLTILGWLSSLSREISRMAVLGTPSVSLGEVGKNRDRSVVTNILFPPGQ